MRRILIVEVSPRGAASASREALPRVVHPSYAPIFVVYGRTKTMCADIYRTQRKTTFLVLPRGASLNTVPEEVLAGLGATEFLSSRELDDPLLSVNTTGIRLDLTAHGYAIRAV